ncbi:uncharacterized protein LACBIDRAFT_316697 [Laccaria bicolor S238N-H82]|uniref:Predicted protein n=1 Tax=Laccaria bicolor (strain S238N-H82 / ATCC MYA-4686) TaxID=486041 RepID=B0E1F5_LACBS|nr:uncharacterized protein LACBIDRAFT_316697 [Laccaria bicolor S238N-H82]EDQ99320.1 predicted protein [Laccaria bicolor S238N-H82]|eukprot:XP_001890040.1 predicted protein [Laccaria bicolor S238N-H82]
MAITTDYEVPVPTSSSTMTAIEDAIRSLRLTHAKGQDFVRAFVQIVDRSTGSPHPSTPPVILDHATSPISTSYDILGFDGDEDLNNASKEACLDHDGAGDMQPFQCPICASRSIAAASVNVVAAIGAPPSASVTAATPIIASLSTASGAYHPNHKTMA